MPDVNPFRQTQKMQPINERKNEVFVSPHCGWSKYIVRTGNHESERFLRDETFLPAELYLQY